MKINKKIIGFLASTIIPIALLNLGISIFNKEKIISMITILISFISIYLLYYSLQIKTNEEAIKNLREWVDSKEEILNTLKDIVILKKVSKI